jgi:hypothetical protein
MWTELAFSDGSSIVLEPRADFTLQGFGKNPRTGHLVIRGSSGRGRLRISTSGNVDVVVQTGGSEVEVVAATAVVLAGMNGSAILISGKSVEVRRGDRDDVLRRPGFAIAFADGAVQRLSPQQLSEALDSFAPVAMGGGPANAVLVAEAGATTAPATAGTLTQLNPNNSIAGLNAPNQGSGGSGGNSGGGSGGGGGGNVGGGGGGNGGGGGGGGPRTAIPFSLAAANLSFGAPNGSTIAAPGANSGSSSINTVNSTGDTSTAGNGATVGVGPVPDALIASIAGWNGSSADLNSGLSQFGTGRVRRFAPDTSGACNLARCDSGTVKINGKDTPVNSLFQDISKKTLNANGQSTFYDAIANVGIVSLITLESVGKPNPNDPAGGLAYQFGLVPRISVSDPVTPNMTYDLKGNNTLNRTFNGSAVFEIALNPNTPNNGAVSALQGSNGVLVFKSASGLPSPNPSLLPGCGAASPANCGTFPAYQYPNGDRSKPPTFSPFFGSPTPDPTSDCSQAQSCNQTARRGAPATPGGPGDRKQVLPAPFVYIIDKVTASSDTVEARGIQPGERFFVIGGAPVPPTSTGLPGAPPGAVTRFAISDGVNPLGGFATGQTIEQQFIAPGNPNQPPAFNQFNAFRPEETFVQGAARGDTHLLVVSDQAGRNPAMRADLQIASNGASSASASVGGIGTITDTRGNPTLALSGATVGSSQPDTTRAGSLVSSNLGSLGTADDGVGAHMFPGSDKAPGQVGYFAVSQADTRLGAPGTPQGIQPGTIQPVGNPSATSQFAYTRLATNVGPPPNLLPSAPLDSAGFATGVVQSFTNGQGSLYAVSTTRPEGVTIKSNASNTEFAASFNMASTSVGSLASDPQAAAAPVGVPGGHTLNFGGNASGPPTTAVISPATFAAVAPGQGQAMASVDGDLLNGIANRTDIPPSNEHVAWGFFLGDLAEKANGLQQNNVNLGFWVAGRPVPASVMQSLTGTATYGGGLVGTAVDNNGMRTVTGNFAQFWDFGARKGSMNANFDSRAWAGLQSSMLAGSNVFTGSGMSGDRLMSVQGAFFHNTATGGALSAANLPAAIGGQFAVQGPAYGANGIMVGRR